MNKFAIRLLTLAVLSLTLVAAPVVTVVYAQPDNDPPPPDKGKYQNGGHTSTHKLLQNRRRQ